MNRTTVARPLFLVLALTLLAVWGSFSGPDATAASTPAPLSADNLNLIFVVSEDLAYQASGDVNPATANLTNRGLQRSLRMATFLRRHVLGKKNVTGIYVLEPMTHLQTASNYPDMAAPETIQQFALLNHITLSSVLPPEYFPYTGNSYPLNASYAPGSVPAGVATPTAYCPNCQGLDFNDQEDNNETLVAGIVTAEVPGFYVFSAPWETTSALMANINEHEGYNLTLPASYAGPNYIYAISIAPTGKASLVTFNSHLHPPSTYPKLPSPRPVSTPCTAQEPFSIDTSTIAGAVIPPGINTNETIYIIRHADAHPLADWNDGNYVCAGQWRALDLPKALRGKISPNLVYSSDPAQTSPGTEGLSWSGVAPSLTAEPYAIANSLPYGLAASFVLSLAPISARETDTFFFYGPQFSSQTVLLAWSYQFIQPMVNALVASYFPPGATPPSVPDWPGNDYDTVWKVRLDADGNLIVNNAMCEGIDSAALPATCPKF
ncbi:MAG: hypothetical protein WCE23_06735 [Candidatus Binatus sp.]|uniref:hypothetical protein n=1 Tax=Candidatus Binatus sp. TaxID=2811406 RepID=UPI003C742F42